jgi:hypothetical protein
MLCPLTKNPQIRNNVNQSMGPAMYDQVNLARARLNPASRFKRPMDVVKALMESQCQTRAANLPAKAREFFSKGLSAVFNMAQADDPTSARE